MRKVERKISKTHGKKNQNSRKKLKFWEALASNVYPSDVKKSLE